tara:strand:- start:5593 stop:7164 length:1572 start_codon:yes stop_codon:yes gene_type:complete
VVKDTINKNLKKWDLTRELYTDWVADSKLKEFFTKNCLYEGFSIWWITKICNKNNTSENKWYYDLKENLFEKKNKDFNLYFFLTIFILKFLKNFSRDIVFNSLLKIFSYTRYFKANKNNCFYSNLKALKKNKHFFIDELYALAPIKKNKNQNLYLINIVNHFEFLLSIFTFKKKLKKLNLPYVISNEFISIHEIIKIHFITFSYFLKTLLFIKSKKSLFFIKNKDCRKILEPFLLSSFAGEIQLSLIQSVAVKNYIKNNNLKNFISYVEFNPLSRSIYYFARKADKKIKIIGYQHSYCNKNVLPYYHRAKEFTNIYNEGLNYSPSPDYFFVQGTQFKKLLSSYYKKKIFIVGSLRYDVKTFKRFKNSKKINNILICPSIGDQEMIVDYLNNLKKNDYKFILSPHPRVKNETIKIFKDRLKRKINLKISQKPTEDIFKNIDLILCGHSSVAFEAKIQNKLAVRVISNKHQPIFDLKDGIKNIYSKMEINEALDTKKNNTNKSKDYFYKLDNKSYARFWNKLANL